MEVEMILTERKMTCPSCKLIFHKSKTEGVILCPTFHAETKTCGCSSIEEYFFRRGRA